MAGPSGDKLIYVDMTRQTTELKPFPAEWKLLGGRALSAKILVQECNPRCDPLGPENVLVMAPGVLSGTSAPTSGRISIGGKSPLTGGIKEANSVGQPGQHLMKLGFRAIVVKGQPADANKRYGLEVTKAGVKIIAARRLQGHVELLADRAPGREVQRHGLLRAGDLFVSLNDQTIDSAVELQELIAENVGNQSEIVYERDGKTYTITLVPRVEYPQGQGPIGIGITNPTEPVSLTTALSRGVGATFEYVRALLVLPVRMLQGQATPDEGRLLGYKGDV